MCHLKFELYVYFNISTGKSSNNIVKYTKNAIDQERTEDIVKIKKYCLLVVVWAVALLSGCGMVEKIQGLKAEFIQKISEAEKEASPGKKSGNKNQKEQHKKKAKETGDTQELAERKQGDFLGLGQNAVSQGDYADYFAYHTLDDEEKQVYHEVLTAILGHEENTELSTTDVDVLETAYKAVCADNGGLFWISGYVYTQYTRGKELISMDFTPKYTMEYDEREQIQQQIDDSVKELLSGISISNTDYEKAKYVFEILVQNVDYDAASENNQNIISTFLNRATVCQGYACGTQYLLRLLGIQSTIVSGTANGESHAWNLVRLDGQYYYMDTTWGNSRYLDSTSQAEKYVNYNYLAVTSEEIGRTHKLDNSFPLPDCTSKDNSYFIKEHRYFSEWDPSTAGMVLKEAWVAGQGSVALKFASEELYLMALEYFITEQHIAEYCEGISSIYYLEDKELYVLTFRF